MASSIQFLTGSDVPAPEGATIHAIAPARPLDIDDDKIGFTVDVAMRLDYEPPVERSSRAVIVRLDLQDDPPEELADTA